MENLKKCSCLKTSYLGNAGLANMIKFLYWALSFYLFKTLFNGISSPEDLSLEEELGKEGATYRNKATDIITTEIRKKKKKKIKKEALLNSKEVSGCRLITFCSCFQVIRADFELFKHVTMDDSSTGLRLISSDLTATRSNTYRVRSLVFLLNIPDSNSVNRLLDKRLSRNKHYIMLKIDVQDYAILINLDSQISKISDSKPWAYNI